MNSQEIKTVVIVGAGFGGLNAAKVLARKKVKVILIDRRNYHLFQPLLYQVATAGLSPADIAVPIRAEFSRAPNIEVHMENVESIDRQNRKVITTNNNFSYNYLVLACGSKHSYFGKNEWEENAPGLKTLEQATEIRRRVLSAFESAENEKDPVVQSELLTFVIIGGGPTGVEMAGALAEISHAILIKDFRRIDPHKTRVILVEAGTRLLGMFSEKLAQIAQSDLKKLGVEVRTSSRVTAIDKNGINIGVERINGRTVIWAAGVLPSSLNKSISPDENSLDKNGRLIVSDDLSLPFDKNIFIIGDQAHSKDKGGQPLPGLAPVAIQQGKAVAENILRELQDKPRVPFTYFDKGQMATIGKSKAILQLGKIQFGGWFAWMAWLFVHIYFLVGFRNRVAVLFQWAWNYIFTKRNARLILNKTWKLFS